MTEEYVKHIVEAEKIPEGDADTPEFVDWLADNPALGGHPLASSRRAWLSNLSTYLRDAEWLITIPETGDYILLTDEEYKLWRKLASE